MLDQFKIIEFTDKEFEDFCNYIYDSVGIKLTDKKRNLVHNRLRKLILKTNYKSYGEYFNYVKTKQGSNEFVDVVDAITTNVTSFFRDPKQFSTLSQLVLPYYEKSNRTIKLWSAACSTGEEPYSIAIEILKYASNLRFEIFAADISTKVLEIAKNGVYSYEHVKTIPDHYLKEFFVKQGDNKYEIKPSIKKLVSFKKLNLIEDNFPKGFDIIFCRNVVIYFDKETKDKLYKKFFESINEDGFFFVGHAESLFSNRYFKFFKPSVYTVSPKESR